MLRLQVSGPADKGQTHVSHDHACITYCMFDHLSYSGGYNDQALGFWTGLLARFTSFLVALNALTNRRHDCFNRKLFRGAQVGVWVKKRGKCQSQMALAFHCYRGTRNFVEKM